MDIPFRLSSCTICHTEPLRARVTIITLSSWVQNRRTSLPVRSRRLAGDWCGHSSSVGRLDNEQVAAAAAAAGERRKRQAAIKLLRCHSKLAGAVFVSTAILSSPCGGQLELERTAYQFRPF